MKKSKKCFCALFTCILIGAVLFVLAGCSQQVSEQSASPQRTVTDMAGRTVTLPDQINRVATMGPVPVINSFIFAVGERDKIVNGLPDFARKPRWKYQTVLAPMIADKPIMQNADYQAIIEEVLKANPDVVFCMWPTEYEILEQNRISAIHMDWREPEEIKKSVQLVAEVFNKSDKAEEYIEYFDETLKRVEEVVSRIPEEKRLKVLYFNPKTLTQPHEIAEWWIALAGGKSVTKNEWKAERLTFSIEQLLKWDPDVMIVTESKFIDQVYKEGRYSKVKAVADKKVYASPVGAHVWCNRCIEQPLTVLWAAKTFYPEEFKDLDLEKEVQNFYKKFFDYQLSEQETQEILSGNIVVN